MGEHPNSITNRYVMKISHRKRRKMNFFIVRFYTYERVEEIVEFIRERAPIKPEIAIICGSGLGGLAELVTDKIVIPYADIPHFPRSTVVGHRSNLVFGSLNGLNVVCMQGRFHPYEGYTTAAVSS